VTTALGLDVGGSLLKAVLIDDDDVVVRTERHPVPATDVLGFVCSVVRRFVGSEDVTAVGVGLAGLVSYPAGAFVWGPHLEGESVPYRSVLTDMTGFEVAVDNDANFAAYAEWRIGAGKGRDPLLAVILGTGIGVGLVIGGRIYHGASFAGEAGHMRMQDPGRPCSCGRAGCWETVVSGMALEDAGLAIVDRDPTGTLSVMVGERAPTGSDLVAAARSGDTAALRAFTEAGEWLGRGLMSLILMFDPACIVVGGGAATDGELLLAPARRIVSETLPGAAVRSAVPLVPAALGPLAGAVGAALSGREVQNDRHDR
jgi:glucokinase